MEMMQFASSMRRRSRRGYNRLSPNSRNKMPVVRLGGAKRSWRLRLAPKLRLIKLASPLKLLSKLKNAYVNLMLRLENTSGSTRSTGVFGAKRIPKSREVPAAYSRSEFENRLIFEIYKSMVASYELGYGNN